MGEVEKSGKDHPGKVMRDHPGLRDLAKEIDEHHREVGNSLSRAVEHAIKAGGLLNTVKGQLRHGEWMPWLAENFDGSASTAANYMRCAKNRSALRKLLKERDAEDGALSLSAALKELSTPRDTSKPALEAGEPNLQRPANLEAIYREDHERAKQLKPGDVVPEGHWAAGWGPSELPSEDPKDRRIRELEEQNERHNAQWAMHVSDLYQRFGAEPPKTLADMFEVTPSDFSDEAQELDATWVDYGLDKAVRERAKHLDSIVRSFRVLYLSGIMDENLSSYAVRPEEIAERIMLLKEAHGFADAQSYEFAVIAEWLAAVAEEFRM